MLAPAPLPECHDQDAGYGVHNAGVLSYYVDARERVEVDWTVPAGSVLYKGGDEVAGAMIEGDVVWM